VKECKSKQQPQQQQQSQSQSQKDSDGPTTAKSSTFKATVMDDDSVPPAKSRPAAAAAEECATDGVVPGPRHTKVVERTPRLTPEFIARAKPQLVLVHGSHFFGSISVRPSVCRGCVGSE
jgi:hypothetical protein